MLLRTCLSPAGGQLPIPHIPNALAASTEAVPLSGKEELERNGDISTKPLQPKPGSSVNPGACDGPAQRHGEELERMTGLPAAIGNRPFVFRARLKETFEMEHPKTEINYICHI